MRWQMIMSIMGIVAVSQVLVQPLNAAELSRLPNVVFIMADDLGWGTWATTAIPS